MPSTDFIAPIRAESTRLICPAPTPVLWPLRAYRMAFDFTCLQTFHANSRSRISCSVGLRSLTTLRSASVSGRMSLSCSKHAAGDVLQHPFLLQGSHFDQTQVLLGGENLQCRGIELRRRNHLEKQLRHLRRRLRIDGPIDADHAAERRHGIALQRALK